MNEIKGKVDLSALRDVLPPFLEGKEMNEIKGKVDLSALRDVLPPWVARNWKGWKQNIPLSPRTIANEDSRGSGVKVRMLIGNVVAYERNSLIEFLEGKSRVLGSGGCHEQG